MAIAVPIRRSSRSEEGARTAALYREHGAELLRFAWHRLGRLEDAEDAVQATFLSAHRVLADGEQIREPRAWLFRILRNECLTRIAMTKRRGSHEPLEEWHADPRASVAEASESRDEFDVAVALLGTLPTQQREALVLREWLGLSAIETASVLESTPQGVDALVYRARKSLVGLADVPDASTCAETRDALVESAVTTKVRAHLLACRSCRTAARRLRAPEELAVHGTLPFDSVAARIGESIPGFAAAATTAVVVGSGAAAATVASSLAAGTAVKVVAAVAIGAAVTGGAINAGPTVRDAIRPPAKIAPAPESAPQQQVVVQTANGSATVVAPAKNVAGDANNAVSSAAGVPVAAGDAVVGEATPPPVAVEESVPVAGAEDSALEGVPAGDQPADGSVPAAPAESKQPTGKQEDSKQSSGKQSDSKQPTGKHEDSKQSSGKQSESKQPTGKHEDSKQSDSKQSEVKQTSGKQSDSKQSESKQSDSKQSESKQSSGKQSESKQSEVKPSESKQSSGKQSESKQSEVKPSESKQSSGKQSESKQSEVKPSESKQSSGKQSESKQSEAKQPASQQSEPSKSTITTPPVGSAPPVVPVVVAPTKHDGGDKDKSKSRDSQRD
jgi:RNA polymerase sigma factor (sigma-70 family)